MISIEWVEKACVSLDATVDSATFKRVYHLYEDTMAIPSHASPDHVDWVEGFKQGKNANGDGVLTSCLFPEDIMPKHDCKISASCHF